MTIYIFNGLKNYIHLFKALHLVYIDRYALELHMVHESTDPKVTSNTAVIGILYSIGRPDNFLSKVNSKQMEKQDNNDIFFIFSECLHYITIYFPFRFFKPSFIISS